MGDDQLDERLRYGGWVAFGWRSATVVFPDLPDLRARARCGAGFDESIRAQLARHLSVLIQSGSPLPPPSTTLAPDDHPVRWYSVRRSALETRLSALGSRLSALGHCTPPRAER